MRVLIVHVEAEYFAGAERVLIYYLEGLSAKSDEVAIATVAGSKIGSLIPAPFERIELPSNQKFDLRTFFSQVQALRARANAFDLVHGWAARDWELCSILSKLCRVPALGTLHDHPRAPFISSQRQKLMRGLANHGLRKVACVSEAVRSACETNGYHPSRLDVARNGLPPRPALPAALRGGNIRLGFLGAFSARKGLMGLFEMMDLFAEQGSENWELHLAGGAQDDAGKALEREICSKFSSSQWWPRVVWRGWMQNPHDFLAELDLLIVPSSEFDPFPTVLLEAGQVGIPVLAAKVGGVPEIVMDQKTGWLFPVGDWKSAAEILKSITHDRALLRKAGLEAQKRIGQEFTVSKMVENYRRIYDTIA